MKKCGLFFGSFNPIHIGHLAIANYMLEFEDLDEVRFVVSPQNPFKKEAELNLAHHRVEMVKLAISQVPKLIVEEIELSLPTPSYTIHTLEALKKREPNTSFSIIMGTDNLINLSQWKNAETIKANYKILAYPRPNHSANALDPNNNIKITQAPTVDLSSTQLREWIKLGRNLPYFTPSCVLKYIQEHHLYNPKQ